MRKSFAALRLGVVLLFTLGLVSPVAGAGTQDGEAYVADIQNEIDTLRDQIARFLEIDALGTDATQDDVDELNQLAEDWANYPDDVAAEFEAPAGYEDVEDAYVDLADMVGEMGDLWADYWATESGSAAEDEALDAFNEVFIGAQDQIIVVQDAIDEAGGGTPSTEEATEEGTEEATEEATDEAVDDDYLALVQDEVDTLAEQSERFIEIYDLGADASDDDIDELNQIAEDWATYPDDVAADFPESEEAEYAEVYDAYIDLADTFGDAGTSWGEYWAAEPDSTEEEEAFDSFDASFSDAQDQLVDIQDLIDEAGGSSSNGEDPTEEATEEGTEESTNGGELTAEVEAYLTEVQDTADTWNASISDFRGMMEFASPPFSQEITDIVEDWIAAPDVAAESVPPAGYEDVQETYEAYADELATAGGHFTDWANDGAPSRDDRIGDMNQALSDAEELYETLSTQISEAGL